MMTVAAGSTRWRNDHLSSTNPLYLRHTVLDGLDRSRTALQCRTTSPFWTPVELCSALCSLLQAQLAHDVLTLMEALDAGTQQQLGKLVEALTDPAHGTLPPAELKALKALLKRSDSYVVAAHAVLMERLADSHAQVQLQWTRADVAVCTCAVHAHK